jgi:APA family basic amino acid/polyamine antiporter
MTQTKKLPLISAIFIIINIVVGGGFFISANNIFKTSGILAPVGWILCATLLLPLILVLSKLSQLHPKAGGLYIYSRERLGEFWGFVSGWGYFVGTLAGNAFVLHAFSRLTKEMGFALPFAHTFSPLTSQLIFDVFFLIFFTIINLLNITILEKIHIGFTILKTIPIGLVIIASFFLFDMKNVSAAPVKTFGLIENMPIFLFAYIGIEAGCSITHKIKNGKRNATRAMLIAFSLVMATYAIVQFGLIGILGSGVKGNPFFNIVPMFTQNPIIISWGNLIVKLAILSSYLGGFYGMYYANSWNLYAIAKEKKIFGSKKLALLNKHKTPYVSIFTQGVLIFLLLFTAMTNSLTLLIMSGFGVVIAYTLSVAAYFKISSKSVLKNKKIIIGSLALVGCTALLVLCINDLVLEGFRYLLPFVGVLGFGLVLYRR